MQKLSVYWCAYQWSPPHSTWALHSSERYLSTCVAAHLCAYYSCFWKKQRLVWTKPWNIKVCSCQPHHWCLPTLLNTLLCLSLWLFLSLSQFICKCRVLDNSKPKAVYLNSSVFYKSKINANSPWFQAWSNKSYAFFFY